MTRKHAVKDALEDEAPVAVDDAPEVAPEPLAGGPAPGTPGFYTGAAPAAPAAPWAAAMGTVAPRTGWPAGPRQAPLIVACQPLNINHLAGPNFPMAVYGYNFTTGATIRVGTITATSIVLVPDGSELTFRIDTTTLSAGTNVNAVVTQGNLVSNAYSIPVV